MVGSDRGVRHPLDPKQVVFVHVPEVENTQTKQPNKEKMK